MSGAPAGPKPPRTLVVTNDFGPAIGGIESFVSWVCGALDDRVVVLTRNQPGAETFDRGLAYPVIRTGRILLPSHRLAGLAVELIRRHRLTRVVYGAAAPLGLLAPALRRAGVRHQLALSHGHETWWARVPGTRSLLRRIADQVDHLGYISEFTASVIGPRLSPRGRAAMVRLSPPVDETFFAPLSHREPLPRGGGPVTVVAAGRMIPQKGFHTLIHAWSLVQRDHRGGPRPRLLLIGDGPRRRRLQAAVERLGLAGSVTFTGAVAHADLPAYLRRGDIFALPVRTRRAGLNPEGLGLVFLEAAATGLAVIAGDSGGARETLVEGETGLLVPPDDPVRLARALLELLNDPIRVSRMGRMGCDYVRSHYASDATRACLRRALSLPVQ